MIATTHFYNYMQQVDHGVLGALGLHVLSLVGHQGDRLAVGHVREATIVLEVPLKREPAIE